MKAVGVRLVEGIGRLDVIGMVGVTALRAVVQRVLSIRRLLRAERWDAVVLIDYPGFNWWLARRAHFHGIPVFYFVPPQIWGWAGWRIRKMQRWVDE